MLRLRLGLNDPTCLRVHDGRRLHQLSLDAAITIAGHLGGMLKSRFGDPRDSAAPPPTPAASSSGGEYFGRGKAETES